MRILITGTAGFIGFHLSKLLLSQGHIIHGYDGITNYYDINLKNARLEILLKDSNFTVTKGMLEDSDKITKIAEEFKPEIIIHLAAQAGVRYSLENPKAYIDSNIVGTFNILEIAKKIKVSHLLMASTSSVYGANTKIPFNENDNTDHQLSIYAATKKANENMAHSYSHLWNLPITAFRFFTVYGPWGRPDMALFKFTNAILKGRPIDVFNNGKMKRDFTYVKDLVESLHLLINKIPEGPDCRKLHQGDSLSPVAPFRVINIGNSQPVSLFEFINAIEDTLGTKATYNMLSMQPGDVPTTWADVTSLRNLTNFIPNTDIKEGVRAFVEWYLEFYRDEKILNKV